MLRKLCQFLLSVKAAIITFFLISIIAVFGTLPPDIFGLHFEGKQIFGSWWFLSLLAFLAVSTGFSVISKIRSILRADQPQNNLLPLSNSVLRGPAQHFQSSLEGPQLWEPVVVRTLRRLGYMRTVQTKDSSSGPFFYQKNSWGVWGAPMVHLGIVMVLIGGLLTFLFADVRDINIAEGETIQIPGTQTKINLQKFTIFHYPGTLAPEAYVSRLLVQTNDRNAERRSLQVNQPLMIQQTKLFQMRYRVEILWLEVLIHRNGKPFEVVRLKPGESHALSNSSASIKLLDVIPDFAIDQKGNVSSRSPYFRNIAASLLIDDSKKSGEEESQFWAFQGLVHHPGQKGKENWGAEIQKFRKRYVSGIKLSKDPGVPFAYIGFIFLVIGSFFSGFVIPRLITVHLACASKAGEGKIELAGHQVKDTIGFKRELKAVAAALSKALSGAK